MSNPISGLFEWVTDVVESLGYIGVALMVALENLFPPIPSEIVLPLAGFLVGQGRFSFPVVVMAATAGSIVGGLALYAIGYWFGATRLRRFVDRYGRFFLLDVGDFDSARNHFNAHGTKAVLFGRCIPIIRSLISIPAGLVGMPLGKFILYTAIGSTAWNATLIGLGWILGSQWERTEDYVGYLDYAVFLAIIAGVVWFIWKKRDRLPI